MMRISIRQRLTLWYAAALLVGLGLFALAMWVSLQERLISGVDARLAQRIKGLETALGAEAEIRDRAQLEQELAEFVREIPDGSLVQLRRHRGRRPAPHPESADTPAPRRRDCAVHGNHWRETTTDRHRPPAIRRVRLRCSGRGLAR